jgi:hypothetical protein
MRTRMRRMRRRRRRRRRRFIDKTCKRSSYSLSEEVYVQSGLLGARSLSFRREAGGGGKALRGGARGFPCSCFFHFPVVRGAQIWHKIWWC